MVEVVTCPANQYSEKVIERANFGWKLVRNDSYYDGDNTYKCRLTFCMDNDVPNKERLIALFNKYKDRETVKKPHTVASFVWGSLLFWFAVLFSCVVWTAQPFFEDYEAMFAVLLGVPMLAGAIMITLGIVFRVKYIKKLHQYKDEREVLLQQAKELLITKPTE